MKPSLLRAAASLLIAAFSATAGAQAITENFDNVGALTGMGWFIQNNSSPLGANTWFQGTPTNATPDPGPFNAFNGVDNAYIAVNFASTTGGTGTISNWLLAPNRTLRNGDVFSFYTRKPTIGPSQTDYPDRLEFRMSTNGASTNVGTTAGGVGDFTTLLLSINPTLVTNVYPQVWTQYTVTISGLPAPTSGRLAFRYFVTGAGPTGANSDYIGIDAVQYTPYVCPAITVSPTSLSNGGWGQAYGPTSLSQTGALGAPNYALTAGALPPGLSLSASGTISGTPTATGTFNFTVTVNDASGCSGARAYSITVQATAPGAPQNVVATAGDAQIEVNWTDGSNGGGLPFTGYSATCTDGTNNVTDTGTTAPITVSPLVNGVAHTCRVTATNSAGTGPASAPSNSATPMGNQTIDFDPQAGQTFSPGGTFEIDPVAIASSGLSVTYGSTTPAVCTVVGTTVSIVATGTCTLTADQGGNAAFNAAPQVTQSVAIAQASQVLTFPAQAVPSRDFEAGSMFAIDPEATSAAPNSGAPIVYSSLDTGVCTVSGTAVTMVAVGNCQIAASQAGNADYAAAIQAVSSVALALPTQADLSVVVTAGSPTATIGETVVYTIVVANAGPADAPNVNILDMPPERLDAASVVWACVAATGTVCPVPASDSGALDATIALPEGATITFELMGEVIPAALAADDFTMFQNTASVSLLPASGLTDPVPANDQDSASVLVQPDSVFADGFEDL